MGKPRSGHAGVARAHVVAGTSAGAASESALARGCGDHEALVRIKSGGAVPLIPLFMWSIKFEPVRYP